MVPVFLESYDHLTEKEYNACVSLIKALSGIALYEPTELVMSAKAATPLADIDAALVENRL